MRFPRRDHIAWRALGRNLLRTGLTTLGVVIGVAAVIAMVALGNGAKASMERTLRSAGTSIVQVTAGNFIRGGESVNIASGLGAATSLTREDAAAIAALEDVAACRRRAAIAHVGRGVAGGARLRRGARHRAGRSPTFTAGRSWAASHSRRDDVIGGRTRRRSSGGVLSAQLFGDGVDPVGRQVHDSRPAVHGRRLDARRRSPIRTKARLCR